MMNVLFDPRRKRVIDALSFDPTGGGRIVPDMQPKQRVAPVEPPQVPVPNAYIRRGNFSGMRDDMAYPEWMQQQVAADMEAAKPAKTVVQRGRLMGVNPGMKGMR